jgi:hypothetical protein
MPGSAADVVSTLIEIWAPVLSAHVPFTLSNPGGSLPLSSALQGAEARV